MIAVWKLQFMAIYKYQYQEKKKSPSETQKGLFYEGLRQDFNPRSSGPQADADGYSAVSAVLSEYRYTPIFRGLERIYRIISLHKNS